MTMRARRPAVRCLAGAGAACVVSIAAQALPASAAAAPVATPTPTPVATPVPVRGAPLQLTPFHPTPVAGQPPSTPRAQHRPLSRDAAALKLAKAAANAHAAASKSGAGTASPSGGPSPAPQAAVYNGQNFAGQMGSPSITPSDSNGDASPTQQVEIVNSAVTAYPAACGGACGPNVVPLYNLAGATPADCVFDPQVAWDQQWGHWVYSMAVQRVTTAGGCTGDQNTSSVYDDRLVIGWTYTSDAGDFAKYDVCIISIDTYDQLPDYPHLGHDNSSLIAGANMFGAYGTGAYLGPDVFIVGKPPGVSAANGCGTGGLTGARYGLNISIFTPIPADMTDSSGYDYIVSALQPSTGGTESKILAWRSSGLNGTSLVYLGAMTVASYRIPPDVPQPATGTSNCTASPGTCLDAGDTRLTQAVGHYDPTYGAEAVWTQHAIRDPQIPLGISSERWYELLPASLSAPQSGDVSDGQYTFNGAISPTEAGNEAVVFYNAADSSSYVSFRAQGRNSSTAAGSMSGGEVVLATSGGNDTDFSCGLGGFPCRWGDYSSARPDPSNYNSAWGVSMLVGPGGSPSTAANWVTQISDVTVGCQSVSVGASYPGNGIVQFTASGASGCANPQYEFWLKAPGGSWKIMQPFSAGSTWNWNTTGYGPGTYTVVLWANQAGDSPLSSEGYASTTWVLNSCTSVSESAAPASPQEPGTAVQVTAVASGCPNPLYEFWVLAPGASLYTIGQPYGTSPVFNWTPGGAGTYRIAVWAHDAGDGGQFQNSYGTWDSYSTGLSYDVVAGCQSVTDSASPASPAMAGTTVTVTAASSCIHPNQLYEFWLLAPGATQYTLAQSYSTSPTLTWSTGGHPLGSYRINVWVRDAASSGASSNASGSWDAYNAGLTYTLTQGCPSVSTSASPTGQAMAGTTVTLTASAPACPNPQYEFWILKPGATSYTLLNSYSSSATYTWSTGSQPLGAYRINVWVRDAASAGVYSNASGTWDAYDASLTYSLTQGCPSVTTSASPASAAMAGQGVTLTASAPGCPNPQYEFWILAPGATSYTLLHSYSSSPTYAWATNGQPVGTYRINVWVRDASSPGVFSNASGTWDAYDASLTYTLTQGCPSVGDTASPSGSAAVGSTVTINASAPGCSAPEYELWVLAPGATSYTLVQPYTTNAALTWTTTGAAPGTYRINVWVRQSGTGGVYSNSSGGWDAYNAGLTYTLH